MTKPPASKRTLLPRTILYSKAFLKDWDRLGRTGRFDMNRAKEAMLLLIANDGLLGPEWQDHPLKGAWAGNRELHIGGDFLLIYELDAAGEVGFVRVGTHSELFNA